MLSRSIKCGSGHSVKFFDRDSLLFQVVTRKIFQKGGNSHTVWINESMCSCGKWQTYRILCSHFIACCAYLNLSHERFRGDCYKLVNGLKVYNGIFEPIPSKGDSRWPRLVIFTKVTHDNDVPKKKGRKKFTRFKNVMDFQAPRGKNWVVWPN